MTSDSLKTCLHLTILIEAEVLTIDFDFLSVLGCTCGVSLSILSACLLSFALLEEVPVGIVVVAKILSTVDLVPACCSGTIFYFVSVDHIACGSVWSGIGTIQNKVCCRACSGRLFGVNPLIQHLTMLVEVVIFTVDFFLLAVVSVCFTVVLEVVPAFAIAQGAIIMRRHGIVILVILIRLF